MQPSNRVLITGITGTLGTQLTKYLLETYEDDIEIVGISRDEQKQNSFPINDHRVKLKLADIRNKDSLYRAAMGQVWEGYDCIFHLAALKCAPQLEDNPHEAIATNITGTENILDMARELQSRVCFTSSDKAVYPVNIYGMTKAVGEKLVLADPINVVCRYGNVLGSRGSILPSLVKSLRLHKKAHITDPEMTRFWLPIEDVAAFVATQGMDGEGGLHIPPHMQSSAVKDLIHATAELLNIPAFELENIGVRPGEKMHEHLETRYENGHRDISSGDIERLVSKDAIKEIIRGSVCTL